MTNGTSSEDLDYSGLMQQAWGVFTRKPVELIIGMLVAALTSLAIVTAGAAALGMSHQALEAIRGREFTISTALRGYDHFSRSLVALLLVIPIVCVGLVMCLVPGLIAIFLLYWTFLFMADDPALAPLDALKKSFEFSKQHPVPTLVVVGVALVLGIVGGIIYVGMLVTLPLTQLFAAAVFDALRASQPNALLHATNERGNAQP